MPLNNNELIEIIKKDKSINLIAIAKTPWHAISMQAALTKISAADNLNGYILFGADDYENPKPLINKASLKLPENGSYRMDYHSGEVYSGSKIKNLMNKVHDFLYFLHHKKGEKAFYVLHPMSVYSTLVPKIKKALPECKVISVITDEGLGSYMRSDLNWAAEALQITGSKKEFMRTFISRPLNRFYERKAFALSECIDFRLLKKDHGVYSENKSAVPYYKAALASSELNEQDYKYYEKAVVISAQLYHETNQIKNNADLKLYKAIIEKLKKADISVILKPHPRDKNTDRYKTLNCIVEKNNTAPQESIFECLKIKPRAIIGFTSTSLVTSKIFYGVRGISLNNLLLAEDIDSSLKNEFQSFKKAFSGVIEIPNSIDDFISAVNTNP